MHLMKGNDFTPKKEEITFSKSRKSKVINKKLFPSKSVSFFVSLLKRWKVSVLVEFYNTAVSVFRKLLEYWQGNDCDGYHL